MAFEPYADDHAIKSVVFHLGLNRPLNDTEMDGLASVHSEVAIDLPKFDKNPGIQIAASGDGSINSISHSTGGLKFLSFKRDGSPDTIIDIDKFGFSLIFNSYTGWKYVYPIAKNYINLLLDKLNQELYINTIALHYIDEFKWVADQDNFNIFELVDKSVNFLPNQVTEWDSVWHNHVGFFKTDKKHNCPILCRLNFDAAVENNVPIVRISSMLDFRPQNNQFSIGVLRGNIEVLDKIFDHLHDESKELFGNTITTKIKKKIGLEK